MLLVLPDILFKLRQDSLGVVRREEEGRADAVGVVVVHRGRQQVRKVLGVIKRFSRIPSGKNEARGGLKVESSKVKKGRITG